MFEVIPRLMFSVLEAVMMRVKPFFSFLSSCLPGRFFQKRKNPSLVTSAASQPPVYPPAGCSVTVLVEARQSTYVASLAASAHSLIPLSYSGKQVQCGKTGGNSV